MANTINWGKIYCYMSTNNSWGDVVNKKTIENAAAPDCLIEQIACGESSSFRGGQQFPTYLNVNLGIGTGAVTLDFDALGIPDKFEVWFDGNKVIDTGYRGDISRQASLDTALAELGLPSETITAPPSGTATFNKNTTTSIAQIRVYAPMSGTGWNTELNCPTPFDYVLAENGDHLITEQNENIIIE